MQHPANFSDFSDGSLGRLGSEMLEISLPNFDVSKVLHHLLVGSQA